MLGDAAGRVAVTLLKGTQNRRTRVNPRLELTGVVLTRCDMRKKITEVVRLEVERIYNLLGVIRGDAQLQYACSDGMMLYLKDSRALAEYASVAEEITERIWTNANLPV